MLVEVEVIDLDGLCVDNSDRAALGHPDGTMNWVVLLSLEQAQTFLAEHGMDRKFTYVQGRALKVALAGDTFDDALYDRDNGAGAAATAIACLRSAPLRPGAGLQRLHAGHYPSLGATSPR